jgi:hypothetical protein
LQCRLHNTPLSSPADSFTQPNSLTRNLKRQPINLPIQSIPIVILKESD